MLNVTQKINMKQYKETVGLPFSWRQVSCHPSWLCRLHLPKKILLTMMMTTPSSLRPVSATTSLHFTSSSYVFKI